MKSFCAFTAVANAANANNMTGMRLRQFVLCFFMMQAGSGGGFGGVIRGIPESHSVRSSLCALMYIAALIMFAVSGCATNAIPQPRSPDSPGEPAQNIGIENATGSADRAQDREIMNSLH